MKIYDYDSVKECAKCGKKSHYDSEVSEPLKSERTYRNITYIKEQPETTENKAIPEHLELECNRCGYIHKEHCKDH